MLSQNQNHGLILPYIRLILGISAILLSLVFSIIFISAGMSGAGIITAIIFCLVTEFCKVVFVTDFSQYIEERRIEKALFSLILIALLFSLSISAAIFYLSINPAKESVNIESIDKKIEELNKKIELKREHLSKCNVNYLTKCVNPRTKELDLLNDLSTILSNESKQLDHARAMQVFWKEIAVYFGTDSESLKLNFAILRAILLDLLGLVLIAQFVGRKEKKPLPQSNQL